MQIPLFEITNVTQQKDKFRALDIKKFEIHRGTIYSITGKPAAGKSVLLDLLAKKVKHNSGEIKFDGKDLWETPNKEFQDQIAYVQQNVKAPFFTTVAQYLDKTLNGYSHTQKDKDKRIDSISKKMEITYLMDKPMRSLTPGQLRWVDLATKIAADTKVLLIDEIEQHLSADSLNNLIRILHRKSNYDGVTIVLTTMNPEMLKKIVSVYIAMQGGRISSVRSFGKKGFNKSNDSGGGPRRNESGPRGRSTSGPRSKVSSNSRSKTTSASKTKESAPSQPKSGPGQQKSAPGQPKEAAAGRSKTAPPAKKKTP